MKKNIETLLHTIHAEINKQILPSSSLMAGQAGKALFNYMYAEYFNNDAAQLTFEKNVQWLADNINKIDGVSLSNGRAGVDWFFNYLYKNDALEFEDLKCFRSQPKQLALIAIDLIEKGNYDFLHGATGIAYYLLSVDEFDAENFIKDFFLYIKIAQAKSVSADAVPEYDFINEKINTGIINIGTAHGIAALLKLCIVCYQQNIQAKQAKVIAYTIINYYLLHINKDHSISFFSNKININNHKETKSRLAWCYGDLGIGYMLYNAAVCFNDELLTAFALKILRHAAARNNILTTEIYDACFCHGSAGAAHIFNRLFLLTNDEVFNKASLFWMQQIITASQNEKSFLPMYNASLKSYSNNYTLLNGIAGTGLALCSYLTKNFSWDYCLMLNY